MRRILLLFGGAYLKCLISFQFSGGVDWRQKLDVQRGAVLANELKNNACKLAKWTVQSLLAGSDLIKFGYDCFLDIPFAHSLIAKVMLVSFV